MVDRAERSLALPPERDDKFWQSLQVYPDVIGHAETKEIYQKKALDVIGSLPRSNVAFICERLGVPYDATEDLPQPLAWRLMHSEHARLLTCLAVYLKPRVSYVVDFFEKQFPDIATRRVRSEVAAMSRGGRDTVKPFTKLLSIYLESPENLELIHYTYAWRRMPTFAEFDIEGGVPAGAASSLTGAIEQLLKSLDGIRKGEGFTFFGSISLRPGLEVFVVHRNYKTSVRPDYVNKYRLQHDYSQIVFGLNQNRGTLVIKVGNRAITESISNWVRRTLKADLTVSGGALFTDYDSDRVARSFMGGYDEAIGMHLVGIEFRHSTLPGGSPLSLNATEYNRSIREELSWLRDRGILRLTSLADIGSVTVRHKGVAARLDCQIEKGGAVTFHLIDKGLEEAQAEGIRQAFLDAFHVPVDQRIDPTMMMMGATEIYHHLLSGVEDHQVRGYQREYLHRLIELELLKVVVTKTGKCSHPNCANCFQQFTDDSLVDCPSCQTHLTWQEHKRYKLNTKAVARVARPLLQEATGRTLSSKAHSFESHSVHRLYSKKRPGKFVHVFFNERLSSEKFEVFQRAMFPILIVHPTGSQRAPVIDGDGIAHVGLPHALAANDDPVSKREFRKACREVVRRMMQMEQERVLKAARHSRDSLASKAHGYNDRMFESDVFNLMRRFFPHSIKLGGANKPDGFSSLVFFEEGDLAIPTKINMSYDAKYSDGIYDFGIGEHRQMHEYIKSLSRSKQFQSEGNRYNGHIIIYNSIKTSSMEGAADYLWNIDRLGKSRRDFLLVFMHEGFLTRAWDLIQDHSSEILRRWYAFPEEVYTAMKTQGRDGYTLLDESVAEEVVKAVLARPACENPINHESLLQDLTKHVRQRTNMPGRRGIAASN